MTELSKTYNPKEVEEKWLNIWLKENLFKSEIKEIISKVFSLFAQ